MIWLLRDFEFLAVLLRSAALAAEALTVGGIAYLLLVIIPVAPAGDAETACRRSIRRAAVALVASQVLYTMTDSAILIGSSGVSGREVMTAGFFYAGAVAVAAAGAIWLISFVTLRWVSPVLGLLALMLVAAAVSLSHSASRLEHRAFLIAMTGLHHLGTAAWIGAMPFLLITLKHADSNGQRILLARRFSLMAIASIAALMVSGLGLCWYLVGSWQGLYGTSYGLLLAAKMYLLFVMLALGFTNFLLVRNVNSAPDRVLNMLRWFSATEIGLGFTAILAAASLASQPPAVDMVLGQVTGHQIVQRLHTAWPRLRSPAFSALAPPASIQTAVEVHAFGGEGESDANDRAWSEYNHHWAGIVVLVAALLALLSRLRLGRWAQHWPLAFIGLAVFIVLRADPENWPLGPRPFWASFSQPDVLQHRLFALLIVAFAVFEWRIQTGRSRRGSLIFPGVCALGGALLLLHSHASGDPREEVLVQIFHTPIALLGVTAGWARRLELRLPQGRAAAIASRIWPICLMLVGTLLLVYRES